MDSSLRKVTGESQGTRRSWGTREAVARLGSENDDVEEVGKESEERRAEADSERFNDEDVSDEADEEDADSL